MNIKKNISLKKYNSFKVDATAKYFVEIDNEAQLIELTKKYNFNSEKYFILGNGTNVLFTTDFYDGLVIKNNIKHKLEFKLMNESIIISASSGIDYDILLKKYFEFLTKNNLIVFSGLENLSQIPTSVGGAVIQNVGAYSIEQCSFFYKCNTVNLLNGEEIFFNKNECNFAYRDSFFKQHSNYFITEVKYIIPLSNITPNLNYNDIKNVNIDNVKPLTIYEHIAKIRKNKIPSHIDFPNCGSFFKNPIISQKEFDKIIEQNTNIVHHKNGNKIKLSAANLIENCGLKGNRIGNVGISVQHSLFIINYENATGNDIFAFSEFIIDKIFSKYCIKLVPEVVIVC